MKLRHADLETARREPSSFSHNQRPARIFGGMTRSRVLQLAVYRYHRQGENIQIAMAHLQSLYRRNFKRLDKLPILEQQLEEYASLYCREEFVTIDVMLRLSHPIAERLEISGEISRLDMAKDGGYSVWIFGRSPYDWEDELRMPLLQSYFSSHMGVPSGQVSIGMCFLEASEYSQRTYSDLEIAEAYEEASELARAILGSGDIG